MKKTIVLLSIFLFACIANSTATTLPRVNLDAKDFIVTSESYPADWRALPCESMLCDSDDSSTYEQSFKPVAYEPGQFFQEVHRFSSTNGAKEKFLVYQKGEYNRESLDPNGTDFSTPPELLYTSPIADEYYFACGRQFGLVCKMIARYKNYFVFMYFDKDDGRGYGLTYQEVEKILVGLDEQVISLLYP